MSHAYRLLIIMCGCLEAWQEWNPLSSDSEMLQGVATCTLPYWSSIVLCTEDTISIVANSIVDQDHSIVHDDAP